MSLENAIPAGKINPAEGIFITQEQARAVNVMIAAISVAQKAGAFSLKDSATIYETLSCFRTDMPEEERKEVSQEEVS